MTGQSDLIKSLRAALRRQFLRICAVLGALSLLVAWMHEFIWTGINSNIYLNILILSIFAMGLVLSFRRLFTIRADATAFEALQEAYADARSDRLENLEDPYWKHYRAMAPGIVFRSPRSIGHIFEVAYDEILRTKNLRISVTTLQNIAHGIEGRLVEEKSQINYLAGLLVFLGLIGTFIGLMEMVGSVGKIIGGLNTTDGGSADTMQRLFQDLQQPLNGMAKGFSSSLFGLFGSLVLGLVGRFGSQALASLKNAFEEWLSRIAHIEEGGGDSGDLARLIAGNIMGNPGDTAGRPGPAVTDVGMIATMAQGFGRITHALETLNTVMPKLLDAQTEQNDLSKSMLAGLDRLVMNTHDIREFSASIVAAHNVATESAQEMINLTRSNEARLTSGFNGLAHITEVTGQAYLDGLRRLTAENYETNARLAKLLDLKTAGDRITEIAGSIESKVKNGVGNLTMIMERTAMAIESGNQRAAAEQADMKAMLATKGSGDNGISPQFEERLTAGFGDLSRSMETVFSSFATIINRGLVAQAMPHGEPTMPAPLQSNGLTVLPEHEMRKASANEIDHEEMRRRLYSAAANNLRSAGGGNAA